MVKIMAADDEHDILQLLERILKKEGHKFIGCSTGGEFLKLYPKEKPDLVLLDVMMAGISGTDIYKKIKGSNKRQKVIFLTVLDITPTAGGVKTDELTAYVEKPFEPTDLLKKVRAILKK